MSDFTSINNLEALKAFEDYRWIDASSIVVSNWVRMKCQFGCSDYGLGTCPPNTPDVAQCKEFFSEYQRALLIRFKVYADKGHYPSDWSRNATKDLLALERDVFLKGYPKAFLLNQSCCSICKECTGDRLNCKAKDQSRPSPEAFAVDVYQTASNNGLPIHVIENSPSQIHRIAFVMVD